MNKIKSVKAEDYVSDNLYHIDPDADDEVLLEGDRVGCNPLVYLSDVYEALTLAEQDAEERAVNAAKEWFVKSFPAIIHPATIDIMIDDFKQLLNKEEQGNG